ncbi:hypothetical protein C8A05DRAFT_42662 [Staphylotrichum tortipilum]|uniref:SMODS and SLOG-associating 2TM effector domain-containing protein n=1 Tax=Staphylotrichum tortipilum TaxID=2831512 RepID=A0AAN6MQQ1_9PEZI|nr:hypothetical protein C8A05DRAFT_42662 [Staphylotrichum longicolle]
MDPLDPTSQPPSRIPRPTFMAASPRTPSIRAVPYSHMDRVAATSKAAGNYSPSSWPFPKSAKPSSLDATTQDANGDEIELQDISQMENIESSHQATSSAASVQAKMGSLREPGQGGRVGGHAHTCDSFDSAETQIYVPKRGDSSISGNKPPERSRPNSTRAPFHGPAAGFPERPMTPTPYSVLRKVSEATEPETGEEFCHKEAHQPTRASQHQEIIRTPIQSNPATAIISKRATDSFAAHITPVLRAGEGRASASNSELNNGSSRAAVATCVPAALGLGAIGTLAGNSSLSSRRRTPTEREYPDIDRLPQSVPESTKQLWTAIGQSRRMMLASAILLELSVVNIVASITAVVVAHIADGHPRAGLVAWAIVSSVFVVTFGGLLADFISGETWIEMTSGEPKQDTGATEAWERFAQDHEQLRGYVELLEGRIGNEVSNGGAVGVDIRAPGNDGGGDKTPKAKSASLDGSLSRCELLRPESWQGSDSNDAIPRSDTKTSILTELCEAVTEGYSPLAEHTHRGSPYIPPPPIPCMPSASPRDDTFRRLG